ncbi:MAG: hypothetical protein AB9869_05620 [Verrucomicrobiia bacterium]
MTAFIEFREAFGPRISDFFRPSDFNLLPRRRHGYLTRVFVKPETERTYRCERWRAVTSGVLETAGTTFLLLIAVRWFHAGATAKALVAGGGSLGLILSPMVVSLVARLGWPAALAAARISVTGAVCFVVMAAFPWLPVFVAGSILGMTASAAVIPLLTQIYQENYPAESRGHLFSRTVMIRIGVAALFSDLAGRALSGEVGRFQVPSAGLCLRFRVCGLVLEAMPVAPAHGGWRNPSSARP